MARDPHGPEPDVETLESSARDVLDANWIGASTVPSRSLYPHQWSWDSAFIAIGRSWYDEARARQELMTLFDAQWSDGMLPHIVFNPAVPDGVYFPGPDFWDVQRSPRAPRGVRTSGITQPPVHAAAALAMHRHATDVDDSLGFLRALYPRLVAQHRYLATARDAAGIGLPAIVHPWESGFDNSPLWDRLLAGLVIDRERLPAYRRLDLQHADADDRPSDAAYDGFVHLAARYRDLDYDDRAVLESTEFVFIGPGFGAIYLWSTRALAEIARRIGADPEPHEEAAGRAAAALTTALWSESSRRFDPLNVRSGELDPEHTIVSFLPLLIPACLHGSSTSSAPTWNRPASTRTSRPTTSCRHTASRATGSTGAGTGGGRSGSTRIGCCGTACASMAASTSPPRSAARAWPSSRAPASANTSTRSMATDMARPTSAGVPP